MGNIHQWRYQWTKYLEYLLKSFKLRLLKLENVLTFREIMSTNRWGKWNLWHNFWVFRFRKLLKSFKSLKMNIIMRDYKQKICISFQLPMVFLHFVILNRTTQRLNVCLRKGTSENVTKLMNVSSYETSLCKNLIFRSTLSLYEVFSGEKM